MHELRKLVQETKDFPKHGVLFYDVLPIFNGHESFLALIIEMERRVIEMGVDPNKVVGLEARGFIIAPIVAANIPAGFVPVRKVMGGRFGGSKLPRACHGYRYDLEYGSATLNIHQDSIQKGDRVLIVDDVLATGGSAYAAARLVEMCGGIVSGFLFILEIEKLAGRSRLEGYLCESIIKV